ncbi:MAG: MOSC domain-containing protein [Candidatus Nanopelagicaceae bacterium]|jgi:MOSC domain-containing protein YiiM|nr:MOSC domain-containing protein [Candidatus Nanopelagicaceae bacterium]
MAQTAKVLTVNVAAVVHEGAWTGSEGKTGIDKRPVNGAIRFTDNGLAGDVVVDKKHHGGFDKAVYAYASEDARWWERQIGVEINNGAFGENLTTEGIDVNGALIGERWRIGNVLLEVSEPRIPCRVFAGFWDRPTLIKDFTAALRPGSYLRIIEEGEIKAGDLIRVEFKPQHEVTIRDLFAAKSGERGKITQLKEVTQLSESYKDWLAKL